MQPHSKGNEKLSQEMIEGSVDGGQLDIVLDKEVEQSSKEPEAVYMQVEEQIDVMDAPSNNGMARRTGKQLKVPVLKRKSMRQAQQSRLCKETTGKRKFLLTNMDMVDVEITETVGKKWRKGDEQDSCVNQYEGAVASLTWPPMDE